MKILRCYPFKNRLVKIAETYGGYVGNLGDDPEKPHQGTDYVWKNELGVFAPFEVFSTHEGVAFKGESNSWGNFVKIYTLVEKEKVATVYAHLKDIPKNIPTLFKGKKIRKKKEGLMVKPGDFLGVAWKSGWAKGCPQLHFELHLTEVDKETKEEKLKKLDPYGIYEKIDCKKYPQPGESLEGLEHFWTTDSPPFADEV